jgi:hypothetical protein
MLQAHHARKRVPVHARSRHTNERGHHTELALRLVGASYSSYHAGVNVSTQFNSRDRRCPGRFRFPGRSPLLHPYTYTCGLQSSKFPVVHARHCTHSLHSLPTTMYTVLTVLTATPGLDRSKEVVPYDAHPTALPSYNMVDKDGLTWRR